MILIQHFYTKILNLHRNELWSWFLDFSTSFFTENPIKPLKPFELQPELEKITTLDFFKYLAFSRDRPIFQEKRSLQKTSKNAGEIWGQVGGGVLFFIFCSLHNQKKQTQINNILSQTKTQNANCKILLAILEWTFTGCSPGIRRNPLTTFK